MNVAVALRSTSTRSSTILALICVGQRNFPPVITDLYAGV